MAYGEFYVERQYWARFPKVLIMCRKHGRMENGNCAVERRRYVPERTCEVVKGKCSNCGKDLPEDPYSDYEGNYCPSCGAKVVGEC